MVPKYSKKRVSDMVGILKSEHRMEIEQMIEEMQSIADVECYLVIVPTVGYCAPEQFACSLFWNWSIGEPRGNGLLVLIAQQEATIHIVPSNPIGPYFHQRFIELVTKKIFQPLVKEGDPSYAILQLMYGIARQAHEFRHQWNNSIVPLPTKNKIARAYRFSAYGATKTTYFWISIALFGFFTVILNLSLIHI